jgi:CRP-like cAMP-binding protein
MPKTAECDGHPFRDHGACNVLTDLTRKHGSSDPERGHARRHEKGSDVWRAGDRADRLFLLQRGQVLIVVSDVAGHEVVVRVVDAGEHFGELCFCAEQGSTRDNSARAMSDCEAIEVHFAKFVQSIRANRRVMSDVVLTMCTRLAEAERRIDVLSYRAADDRLARLLLHIVDTKGAANSKHQREVTLALSHEQIAVMAAMSRPHVSVTMGKLRKLGLIDYGRDTPLRVRLEPIKAFITRSKSNT